MKNNVKGILINFSDSSLDKAILSGQFLFENHIIKVFKNNKITTDNTFFTVTPVSDLSQWVSVSKKLQLDHLVFSSETSRLLDYPGERGEILEQSLASGTTTIDYNKELTSETQDPHIDLDDFDRRSIITAKNKSNIFVTLAYHELIYSYLYKILKVIFILDKNLREKFSNLGSEEFKKYIIKKIKNKMNNKKYENFKNYRKK